MDAKRLFAAAAVIALLLAHGSAIGGDVSVFDVKSHAQSNRTRAEVIAEREQARARGELNYSEVGDRNRTAAASGRTREEVRAEAVRYVRTHKPEPDYDYGG